MDVAMVNGIRAVIEYLLQFAMLLVFVSILVSFVGDSSNQIVQMIYAITEPMYRPIRKFTKNIPGPFDWAPFIVILIIIFLQNSIVAWMRGYG
ncbi:MAG: YggT family protein [Pseudobacteriovorax sp.]|nr:YggT family protein [Pseudobacteriovorax sp.]